MYPQFPDFIPTITAGYPKPDINELMDVYDELTSLGLTLLPKRRRMKVPIPEYWQKEAAAGADFSREAMEGWQHDENVCGWCVKTGRFYVVDIDPADVIRSGVIPAFLYDDIQAMSESGFVLASPSGGVHIYYRIPDEWEVLPNAKIFPGVDGRGDGGQVITIGGFNRYAGGDAVKKSVPDGHYATYRKLDFGIYTNIPTMSEALYNHIKQGMPAVSDVRPNFERAKEYQHTEQASARVSAHRQQSEDNRQRVVLEALSYVLKDWNSQPYEDWLAMWMSAWDGCSTAKVLEFIVSHPDVYWKNQHDKETFIKTWFDHEPRPDGYTVATLFWLARHAGWLQTTGAEITLFETISTKRISDWFETQQEIPPRLLLVSQTGSGKTFSFIRIWQWLNHPKCVAIVPTIKLAKELATTFRKNGLPAVLYTEENGSISAAALRDAQLLVTTLQTFAVKAHPDMSEYGLVLFEESDQLFRQFARGGGGLHAYSHVREHEAQDGFRVIHDAFQHSGYVFCFDATMSKVTETLARQFSSLPVRVVVNKETNAKAAVQMLPSKDAAMQVMLEALGRGKRVVVASDTARSVQDAVDMAVNSGVVREREALAITAKSEQDTRVIAFMSDVNAEAENYRLVAYNSAMGSGVSITSVQPDVLVQIADYLPPRDNLQIVNRYRRQNMVYIYYRTVEDLYAPDVESLRQEMVEKLAYESGLMNVPLLERTRIATVRAEAALLATADEHRQNRAPRDFYINLLRQDGRKVTDNWSEAISGATIALREQLVEIRKQRAAEIAAGWQSIEPVDFSHPAPAGLSPLQVAMGERHAAIKALLLDNIPEGVDPVEVNRVVSQFEGKVSFIYMLLRQERTFQLAERALLDRKRAMSALENRITKLKLAVSLFYLYHDLDDVLTPELLAERLPEFVKAFDPTLYDRAVSRAGQKYDKVYDPADVPGSMLALSKIMLAQFGLKQRAEKLDRVDGKWRMSYSIENAADLRAFIAWRHPEGVEPFSFEAETIQKPEDLTADDLRKILQLYEDTHPGSVANIKERLAVGEW